MNSQQTTLQNSCKYKVVFLGDASVGKTSLVQYIMNGSAGTIYQPTICLESAKKMIVHKNQMYKLMLWDTAGQQKFNSLIPSFIRGCDCAIITYDITNIQSLTNCQKWLKMLKDQKNQQTCAVILTANKIDIKGNRAKGCHGFDLAIRNNLDYVEVSAMSGEGVENLVYEIVQSIQRFKNKSEKQTKCSEGECSNKILLQSKKISTKLKIKDSSCCSI